MLDLLLTITTVLSRFLREVLSSSIAICGLLFSLISIRCFPRFEFSQCDIWYMRFSLDYAQRVSFIVEHSLSLTLMHAMHEI